MTALELGDAGYLISLRIALDTHFKWFSHRQVTKAINRQPVYHRTLIIQHGARFDNSAFLSNSAKGKAAARRPSGPDNGSCTGLATVFVLRRLLLQKLPELVPVDWI